MKITRSATLPAGVDEAFAVIRTEDYQLAKVRAQVPDATATVADARFAKPLDADLILRLAREHEALITVEEGAMGGFGAFVLQLLAEKGALDGGLKIRTLNLPDVFQDQDAPMAMYAQAGLNAEHITAAALQALGVTAGHAVRA